MDGLDEVAIIETYDCKALADQVEMCSRYIVPDEYQGVFQQIVSNTLTFNSDTIRDTLKSLYWLQSDKISWYYAKIKKSIKLKYEEFFTKHPDKVDWRSLSRNNFSKAIEREFNELIKI